MTRVLGALLALVIVVTLGGCGLRGGRVDTSQVVSTPAPTPTLVDDGSLDSVLGDLEQADSALGQSDADLATGGEAEARDDE